MREFQYNVDSTLCTEAKLIHGSLYFKQIKGQQKVEVNIFVLVYSLLGMLRLCFNFRQADASFYEVV